MKRYLINEMKCYLALVPDASIEARRVIFILAEEMD